MSVKRRGLLAEYAYFFKTYKMWWLLPIIMVTIILGALVVMTGTQGALLIYALF
jgi:hypothetical protein